MKHYIGIDIGGTKCAVVICTADSDVIIDKISFPTESTRGWQAVISEIIETVNTILRNNCIDNSEIISAGISCGGPLDSKNGVIKCPPNLPDWDNVPITDIISDTFGFPVLLQNDANACALAEWKFGAGKGFNNVIFLTFGTGMGAGLILDGKLYTGTNDMAGEVGHIRLAPCGPLGYGKNGSFEGFCSGGGIADFAKSTVAALLSEGKCCSFCKNESELDTITAKSVAEAAVAGDETAIAIYETCGKRLGEGLSILIDILNPEAIIIGSIYERSGNLLRESMSRTVKRESLEISRNVCKILPAALGDKIGDYAALGVAKTYEGVSNNENC